MSLGIFDDHTTAGCFAIRRLFSAFSARLSLKRSTTTKAQRNPHKEGDDNGKSVSSDLPSTDAGSPLMSAVMSTVGAVVDTLDTDLRALSLQIHVSKKDHPELMFEEHYAHQVLCDFMERHGFVVTRHYLGLQTAWRAEFIHVSGVGVAIAVKAALQTYDVPGTVVLLGTPGEEGGGGKAMMLERGGYRDMDVCLMCHPTNGAVDSVSLGSCLAMQSLEAEFFGHPAHAGNAPWDGTNALDAAFLAYSSIAVLRQQIKPDHRVHGMVKGCDSAPNVIPDYVKMRWTVRAPTKGQLMVLLERVKACFEGAALATSCRLKITTDIPYHDLHQNSALGKSPFP
ncbi:hypothetical protein ID866_2634 [Astraeus odoratus]|nr:hypothetical protein ID866_2634 [Astraeus odoratus]